MAILTSRLVVSLVDRTAAGARSVARNMTMMQGAASAATPVLNRTTQAVRQQARTMRALRTTGGNMPGLGTMMGAGGLFALFSDAYSFDKDLRYLGATAELSTDRMNSFADSLAKVASIYPKTRAELLRASVEGVTAGLDVGTIENLLPAITKISMAVREDMGQVTGDLTDIVMGAGMKFRGESAATQVDAFMQVARMMISGTTMFNQKWEGFVNGLRHAAPVASSLGIELTKTVTMLGFLADAGFKGERGGTALRTILINLINPTKKAQQTMRKLRLDMNKFLNLDDTKMAAWELFDKDGKLTGGLKASLAASGIQVLKKDIPALRKILNDPKLRKDVTAFNDAVTGFLTKRGYVDKGDLESTQLVQEAVTQHVMGTAKNFDIVGLLTKLKDANPAELAQLAGKRRLPMLIALINNVEHLTEAEKRLAKQMLGIVDRRAEKQLIGFAATLDKLRSSFDEFLYRIYESGVFDVFSEMFVGKGFDPSTGKGLGGLSKFIQDLGQSNPAFLKFGLLATTAMVALAPLGFVLTGAAAALTKLHAVAQLAQIPLTAIATRLWAVGAAGKSASAATAALAATPLFAVTNARGASKGAAGAASARMLSGMGKGGQMIAGMSAVGHAAIAATPKVSAFAAAFAKLVGYIGSAAALVGRLSLVGAAFTAIAVGLTWLTNNASNIGQFFVGFAEGVGLLKPIISVIDSVGSSISYLVDLFGKMTAAWGESAQWRQSGQEWGRWLSSFWGGGNAGMPPVSLPDGASGKSAAPAANDNTPPLPERIGGGAQGAAANVNSAEIAKIKSQAVTVTATVQDSMNQVRAIVAGVDLSAEGERMMQGLAAGIRRGGAAVRAATQEAAAANVRNAVRGAYSDGGR